MRPSDLFKRYTSLPTILDFGQELQLIQEMQQFDLDAIVQDSEAFIALRIVGLAVAER